MPSQRTVRSKLSCMPSVRAYQYDDIIVLKYYDDGQSGEVHCPHCEWSGTVNQYAGPRSVGFSEMKCPDCSARLGTITISHHH